MQKITKQYIIDILTDTQGFLSWLYKAIDTKKLPFNNELIRLITLSDIKTAIKNVEDTTKHIQNFSMEDTKNETSGAH